MEAQLISRILRKGALRQVIDWGVSLDDFLTDEPRHIFSSLVAWMSVPSNKGGQIGHEAAQQLFPFLELCDDEFTPTEVLCTEVRKNRLRVEIKSTIQRMLESVDNDPMESASVGDRQLKSLMELGYSKVTDIKFSVALDRAIARMELIESGVDLSVAKWPWEPLNTATLGLQADDYIVYYGRPKSKKTWMLAYHVAQTYLQGKRPLIYTKEMHPDNIHMRVAACIAQIPYQPFRIGGLEGNDRKRLYELRDMVRDLHSSEDMICLSGRDAPGGKDTVEWLQAKIEKYNPDVVFIDGMYLMSDGSSAKNQKDNIRVQNISRGIRQMVLTTGKPAVCTLQANRQAAKNQTAELDEIAFSDAIGMDATVIIRVVSDKTTPTAALVLGGSREFSLHGLRVWAEPASNFEFKEEMTEKDIAKAKAADKSDSEPAAVEQLTKNKGVRAEAAKHTDASLKQQMRINGLA